MRVLSGIQPTGNLHLGNYLGAIRNWVRMQDEMPGEKLYFLADLHAITVHNDPAELTANTREMAAALMAAGIVPAKSILFNQARVPAHAELAWRLNTTRETVTRVLQRLLTDGILRRDGDLWLIERRDLLSDLARGEDR